jgi:hypothetical protein
MQGRALDANTVVYAPLERVVIIREVRADYLIEDLETGQQYLVDQTYFRRKYGAVGWVKDFKTGGDDDGTKAQAPEEQAGA